MYRETYRTYVGSPRPGPDLVVCRVEGPQVHDRYYPSPSDRVSGGRLTSLPTSDLRVRRRLGSSPSSDPVWCPEMTDPRILPRSGVDFISSPPSHRRDVRTVDPYSRPRHLRPSTRVRRESVLVCHRKQTVPHYRSEERWKDQTVTTVADTTTIVLRVPSSVRRRQTRECFRYPISVLPGTSSVQGDRPRRLRSLTLRVSTER